MKAIVIGLGRMGRRHVKVLQDLGFELVGLCDQSRDAILTTQKEFSLDTLLFGTDPEAMLKSCHPQAVVVATTAPSHAQLVNLAASSGARYVLCEKPLATSIDDASVMLRTCETRGVKLAVNHQMQFMVQYVRVKEMIASDHFGQLVGIMVAGSNFGLAMNGSHYFEMYRYISESEVKTVQAWFDTEEVPNPRGTQFKDSGGQFRVVGHGGIPMFMDLSVRAGHGIQVIYTCRLGQIVVDELSGYVRAIRRQDQYRDLPTTRYGMPAVEEVVGIPPADVLGPTRAVWEAMLAEKEYPNGHAGLHALRCLCAAQLSNELQNTEVKIDDPRLVTSKKYPWA